MRLFALLLLALVSSPVSAQTGSVDAGRGSVPVFEPAGYDPEVPTPVVIVLHSLGRTGMDQENYFQLASWVDTYGFLYALPNGLTNSSNQHYWNATDSCCDFENSGVDDVGYLMDLVSALSAAYNVDDTRIYLIGQSNGAFMAHRMACEHPDVFAGIISFAGTTWEDSADCVSPGPVHLLQIHGTNDAIIQYGGGIGTSGVPYPGAVETVEYWADIAGCSLVPDTSSPNIDLDLSISGDETTVTKYATSCNPAGSAELWSVVAGGHNLLLPADFGQKVLDWAYGHTKPCGTIQHYCQATPNSTGLTPAMGWAGSPSIAANDLVLSCWPLPSNSSAVFIYSPDQVQVPLGNGNLCVGTQTLGFVVRFHPVTSDATGLALNPVDYDNPTSAQGQIYPSTTWNFSCWYRDPAAGGAFFNFGDGLRIVFCP